MVDIKTLHNDMWKGGAKNMEEEIINLSLRIREDGFKTGDKNQLERANAMRDVLVPMMRFYEEYNRPGNPAIISLLECLTTVLVQDIVICCKPGMEEEFIKRVLGVLRDGMEAGVKAGKELKEKMRAENR